MADAVFDDGSLDEEKARVLWFANANPSFMRSRRTDDMIAKKPGEKTAEAAAKARGEYLIKTETAEVDLETKKINLEKLKRSLVPVEEARRAVRAVAFSTREAMLNFPAKFGAEIAGELGVDPGTLIALLDARVRTEMNRVASKAPPKLGDE